MTSDALRESLREMAAEKGLDEKRSVAQQLVDLIEQSAELFHDEAGEPFARLSVAQHYENWPIQSSAFKGWLGRQFYEKTGRVTLSQATKDAEAVLIGKAKFSGSPHPVSLRIGEYESAIYLDLADDDWSVIKVTVNGWTVTDSPVRFRRSAGMLPLPAPVAGGCLDDIFRFLNVEDRDCPLVRGWLIGAVNPKGPYPVLVLQGEHGSAKSTNARIVRALIDPNRAGIRAEPRDERDLIVAARHAHIAAFDNLSRIQPWLSDAICRLATGTGFGTRQLHTTADEFIFEGHRPVIVNSIENLVDRADLMDRAVTVRCPPIAAKDRRTEAAIYGEFEEARPALLGALLDHMANALRERANINLPSLPRMADFAAWVYAAETKIGDPQSFLRRYESNRDEAVSAAIEDDVVAQAVTALLATTDRWEGRAQDLLKCLTADLDEKERIRLGWPKTPRGLRGALDRLAPHLRAVGISFIPDRSGGRRSLVLQRGEAQQAQRAQQAQSDTNGGADVPDGRADLNGALPYIGTQKQLQRDGRAHRAGPAPTPNIEWMSPADADCECPKHPGAEVGRDVDCEWRCRMCQGRAFPTAPR